MIAGLSPVVPGAGVCDWLLELCEADLQAQLLGNILEDCQGQMFPKSLPTPLADRLAHTHTLPQAVIASGMQSSRCGSGWGNSKAPKQASGLGVHLPAVCLFFCH